MYLQSTVTQSGYGFVHFTSDYHGIQSALRAVGGLDNKVVEGITYSVEPSKNLLKQFESMPGYKDPALATMGMPTLRTGATANYNQRNELNLNAPVYNPSQHNYQQPQMGQMHERMAPPLYMPAMMQSSLGGTRSGATTPPTYYPRRSENIQQSRPRIDDLLGLNDPYQRKSVGQFNTAKSASVTRCVSPVNDMYNHYSKSAGNTPRIPMHWDNDLNGPPGLPTQSRSLNQPQSGSYAAHRLEGDCSQYKSSQSYSSRSLADWSLASGHSNNMMANDFSLVRVSPPVPQLHLPASQDDFFYESVNAGYIAALPPLSRTGSHSDLSQLTTNSNNLEDIAFEKLDKQGLLGNTATNSINSGFTSLEGDRSTGMNGSTTLSSLDAYSMNCSLNKFNAIDQERAPVEDIYGSLDACY